MGPGLVLDFIIFDFRDMLVTNDSGGINAAGVKFVANVNDLLRREWWTAAGDII